MIWKSLGAIRFFLALIVACGHVGRILGGDSLVALFGFHFSAQAAVLGFLVISGFSIAASYFRQPKGYYMRRVLRIIPLYFFCVAVSIVIPILHGGPIKTAGDVFSTSDTRTILGNLLFLQGFLVQPISTNAVVWTLSIEVFFYVITPLLARLRPAWIALACLCSCVAYGGWRFLDLPFYGEVQYGAAVIFMGWAWLLGFWIYRMNINKDALFAALVAGICVIAFNGSFLGWLWPITWCLSIAGIGYGGVLPANRALAACFEIAGDASYSLYLVHMPCLLMLEVSSVPRSALLWIGIVVLVSVITDQVYDRRVKSFLRKHYRIGERRFS